MDTLFTRTAPEALRSEYRPAWDTLQRLTGDATFVEVFAQAPPLLDFVMHQFYAAIFFGGDVPPRYKQLARLQLSLLHGCRTCNQQNVPGALAAGFTAAQVEALEHGRLEHFDAADRAVIDYARQMDLSNAGGRMEPELFARLRAHLSEAQILELGTAMAVICGMAKLSFVLNLVERETYCPFAAGP